MLPTVRTIPRHPKDVDQYRYQDHQQVVKIELKRRLKAMKVDERDHSVNGFDAIQDVKPVHRMITFDPGVEGLLIMAS